MLLKRLCRLPRSGSCLLLGPRQTGKSTLVRSLLRGGPGRWICCSRTSSCGTRRIRALPARGGGEAGAGRGASSWTRCRGAGAARGGTRPDRAHGVRFMLTGSSARKLRRGAAICSRDVRLAPPPSADPVEWASIRPRARAALGSSGGSHRLGGRGAGSPRELCRDVPARGDPGRVGGAKPRRLRPLPRRRCRPVRGASSTRPPSAATRRSPRVRCRSTSRSSRTPCSASGSSRGPQPSGAPRQPPALLSLRTGRDERAQPAPRRRPTRRAWTSLRAVGRPRVHARRSITSTSRRGSTTGGRTTVPRSIFFERHGRLRLAVEIKAKSRVAGADLVGLRSFVDAHPRVPGPSWPRSLSPTRSPVSRCCPIPCSSTGSRGGSAEGSAARRLVPERVAAHARELAPAGGGLGPGFFRSPSPGIRQGG